MCDTTKTIRVFSGSLVKIQKLKFDLEKADISVMIRDYDSVAAYTGYVNITREKFQLSIFETDIEKARPIVERFKLRFNL